MLLAAHPCANVPWGTLFASSQVNMCKAALKRFLPCWDSLLLYNRIVAHFEHCWAVLLFAEQPAVKNNLACIYTAFCAKRHKKMNSPLTQVFDTVVAAEAAAKVNAPMLSAYKVSAQRSLRSMQC
jgi:hypothetical protein